MSTFIIKDLSTYETQKGLSNIHDEPITCISRLFNGNFITGSQDATIKIWDVNSGQIYK
jgi:WD40 repeat protein